MKCLFLPLAASLLLALACGAPASADERAWQNRLDAQLSAPATLQLSTDLANLQPVLQAALPTLRWVGGTNLVQLAEPILDTQPHRIRLLSGWTEQTRPAFQPPAPWVRVDHVVESHVFGDLFRCRPRSVIDAVGLPGVRPGQRLLGVARPAGSYDDNGEQIPRLEMPPTRPVTLAEAVTAVRAGASVLVTPPVSVPCPGCAGTGLLPQSKGQLRRLCPVCGGKKMETRAGLARLAW